MVWEDRCIIELNELNQPDIDKIYLYAKDPYEAKYQYLINKREKVGLDHFKDPKAFMEYSNDMQDVYKNIEDYNPNKKRKVLIVFYDKIADMINNNRFSPVVTKLFIRGRKLNISIVFITQSYFKVTKDVRLNSTHFFIMKIPNKRELQQISLNHSSDIDFKDFMKIYKKCATEPYSFLVHDTTLPSDVQKESFEMTYNKIMTIEDQIRDEKLQYDINTEAAKTSALSSGKIDKYEYLTGEEILPLNQQQIIEQAKFTYSPLGKALEKQIKIIEDRGEKQIKAIQDKRPIKSIEKFAYAINDSPKSLKEKEIYNKLTEESFDKINNLDKSFDTNKLVFKYKGNSTDEDFSKFDNALDLINKIRDGEISLNEAKDEQAKLKSSIGEIKRVPKRHLLKKSRKARTNIEHLYNVRKAAIAFFDEYT